MDNNDNNFNNNMNNNYNDQYNSNQNSANNLVKKVKGNKPLIIGIAVVAVIALIIILTSSNSSAKKTLTCKLHTSMIGVVYDTEMIYKIDDGKINNVKVIFTYYLNQFTNVEGDLDAWAKNRIDEDKDSFATISGCSYDSDYSKNKKLVETISCDNNGFIGLGGEDYSGKSADEIYNKLKSKKEADDYTCE